MIFIIFNHTKKALFYHIPKNSGSFVKTFLNIEYDFIYIKLKYIAHKLYPYCYANDEDTRYIKEKKIGQDFIADFNNQISTSEYLKINGSILNCTSQSNKYNELIKLDTPSIINPNEIWKTYLKIIVVRDPYSRFISGLLYINKNLKNVSIENRLNISISNYIYDDPSKIDLTFLTDYIKNADKSNNIYLLHENRDKIPYMAYWHIYETQSQQIYLESDPYIPNSPTWNLLRFENINNDFYNLLTTEFNYTKTFDEFILDIADETKYPKNESQKSKPFYEYYTAELFEFVNTYFAEDFEKFNYAKYNTFDEFLEHYRTYTVVNEVNTL